MKTFFSYFKHQSIKVKLLYYFLCIIIFPIITLSIVGNILYTKSFETEKNSHTSQMIYQVQNNVEFYIKDMENMIYLISKDEDVCNFLKSGSSAEQNNINENNTTDKIRILLKNYTDIHPEIEGILIVNGNGGFVSNEFSKISRDSLTEEKWFSKAINYPETLHLFSRPIGRNIKTEKNYGAEEVVSIVKAINSSDTSGVILLDMNLNIISNTINNTKFGKSGFIFITDSNDEIVYSPLNDIVYRVNPAWFKSNYSETIVKKINNIDYQIQYSHSQYIDWKIIGVFSLSESLEQVITFRNYSIVVGIFTLFLALLFSIYFASSIATPIAKLRALMEKAENGNLAVRFTSKYNDEIGLLGHSFNTMIEKIQVLMDLIYKEQKSKREAELKILQAQIKPHFLYNTLDTIQWMAQTYNADDIVDLVNALTTLFRIGLNKGNELIRVEEELKHVNSYLIIQKVRYEDRFDYELIYDDSVLNFYVIKVILQPLVENAIYHGIKQKREKGKITISISQHGENLILRVTDNGVGIPPEKLEDLNKMLKHGNNKTNTSGYGIYHVNERIALSYGREYGVRFKSTYGEGTTVEVVHPILYDNSEKKEI